MLKARRWLRRLASAYNRFDAGLADRRLQRALVRPFVIDDLEACREIYRLNEPGRFPGALLGEFEESLLSDQHLYLVILNGDRIAGVGGVMIRLENGSTNAWLIFGMIHPELHGRGLGTALLLARLAALPKPDPRWTTYISTVKSSVGFFRRFGFRFRGRARYPGVERPLDIYSTVVEEPDWYECHEQLGLGGVTLQLGGSQVPTSLSPATPNNALEQERGR